MSLITKGRLVSLVSASALMGTMALAAVPASAMAASPSHLTGFVDRDGTTLTAKFINPTAPVTRKITADGYDIAVYFGPGHSGTVTADISGAKYYGVVADGARVNVTGSKVHNIGDQPVSLTNPLFGMQRGRAISYINGARGTISGNQVYAFQKSGIEVSGGTVDGGSVRASTTTSATVSNNVVTGAGPTDLIAQNGIVIRTGANATVKNNTVSNLSYTPAGTEATGLLNYDAGKITVSGNTFIRTETRIDGVVTANVTGHSTKTVRPHAVRIDLFSNAKPAPQAVLGTKLDWKVKVDGKVTLQTKQGFSDHDVVRQYFKAGSGRHVVKVLKNNVVVRNFAVRS